MAAEKWLNLRRAYANLVEFDIAPGAYATRASVSAASATVRSGESVYGGVCFILAERNGALEGEIYLHKPFSSLFLNWLPPQDNPWWELYGCRRRSPHVYPYRARGVYARQRAQNNLEPQTAISAAQIKLRTLCSATFAYWFVISDRFCLIHRSARFNRTSIKWSFSHFSSFFYDFSKFIASKIVNWHETIKLFIISEQLAPFANNSSYEYQWLVQ
jgi:hypothetical protein